mgnify:CR=1 FL=1
MLQKYALSFTYTKVKTDETSQNLVPLSTCKLWPAKVSFRSKATIVKEILKQKHDYY